LSTEPILEERPSQSSILTLRLNRPDRLNALNVELGEGLAAALIRAAGDDSVRAIVITGAGRGFCAGGDVSLLRDARSREAHHELEALVRTGKKIALTIADMPKPVLGSINGPAAGGGANLALACDLRIASSTASFGQSFSKLGLYPDFGGTFFLERLVGPAKAAELFFTGDMIDASEAARLGIYNRVVAPEQLVEETQKVAQKLAAAPPMTVARVKDRLFKSHRAALEKVLDEEIRRQVECFKSTDCLEGLVAFHEKRPPNFSGK
jgi:2-(1,2-epoxy-1,2-dihydrophenyl)acetyl-CoA isomerase